MLKPKEISHFIKDNGAFYKVAYFYNFQESEERSQQRSLNLMWIRI